MASLRYLSGFNGYLPRETGMVIAFIRKPEEFALNRYIQYVPSDHTVGVYAKLGLDQGIRLPADAATYWEDGDERPKGDMNKHSFQFVEFATKRHDFAWNVGYIAIQQASWKPKLVHMDDALSQCMTSRVKRINTLLDTTANWGTSTATANSLNGGAGTWDGASDDPNSPKYEAIFKTLQEAGRKIHLATNGKVTMADMKVVVSPGAAIKIAQSAEMQNYVRESPVAMKVLEDGLSTELDLWGLPRRYKGWEFVVEDSPIVTEYPKEDGSSNISEATTNRTYIKSDSTAWIVSRPGKLDGEYGTKSYSTVQIYHHGGLLEVEAFDEPKHRRVEGHVTENVTEVLAAAPAGYLIQSIV